jgi:ribosomal protein S18 acetylase RimI-like enzyme
MNIVIRKYINPKNEESMIFHDFLNSGFFDCDVNSFLNSQIYYVAYLNNEIVGVRKVLTSFQNYIVGSKWNDRLIEFIDFNKNIYYLQSLAVKIEYRGNGIGSLLLKEAIEDIKQENKTNDYQVFSSLCITNTIKNKYIDLYNFKILKETPDRLVVGFI